MTPATESLDMRAHPFIAALTAGTCPRDAIRRYAIETYVLAVSFPQRLASLVAICPDPAVRLGLLRNILEEEGVSSFDGEHIVRRDDRRHGELARRFAHAAGAGDEDLARAVAGDRRDTWVDRAIAEGRLCAALAYMTVGFEGCVPPTYTPMIDALERHYGFSRDDLEFLIVHAVADADHSRLGEKMVDALAHDAAARAEAATGVTRARTAWWWWHKSFAR